MEEVKSLGPEEVAEIARAVAVEIGVAGDLSVEIESFAEAPFGPFRHSEVRIGSSSPGAAPLAVNIPEEEDTGDDLTISFGKSSEELWGLSGVETRARLTEFFKAVMLGNYEEWTRPGGGLNDSFGVLKTVDGRALLDESGGPGKTRSLEQKGYVHTRFQRY